MANAHEIAARAVEMAVAYLRADSGELAAMADGDLEALRDAARIVREQADTQSKPALGAEHLAFSLITAAYDSLKVKPATEEA